MKVDQAYSSPPLWYDMRGLGILWLSYQSTLLKQIRFFGRFNNQDQHLEVAIGSGTLFTILFLLSKLSGNSPKNVVGFDYAPSMLAGAQQKLRFFNTIQLMQADATKLPLRSDSFDTAHLANAVHCIPNYPLALNEISRVLKPSGILRVNVLLPPTGFAKSIAERVNQWGMRKGILQSAIEKEDFKNALNRSGFSILEEHQHGNCHYIEARKL